MFRRKILAVIALLSAVPVIAPVSSFSAPARVEGARCHFPSVAKGTWVGYFDGAEEAFDLFKMKDSKRHITVWRCFRTKADCTAWKYWMQTDYRAGPQLTWCRKK